MGLYEDHVFPRLCDLATRQFEDQRREIIAAASGRVLEVGVGTGNNLPYYSNRAQVVEAIEISAGMLRNARSRAAGVRRDNPTGPEIEIALGDVTHLDFETASFDTAVSFLVFCSLPDPDRAASELYRVLKPGGQLLVFEHVAAESGRLRDWQDRLNPAWRFFACGCNLNRDTRHIYEMAGFDCRGLEPFEPPGSRLVSLPILRGVALKPSIP